MKKFLGKMVLFLVLIVVIGAFAGEKHSVFAGTIQEMYVQVEYQQTSARSMLSMVNSFRTGNDAWAYDSSNNKVYYSDLKPLTYDYELEKVAMLRAAEIAVSYGHTRPNNESCFTACGELGLSYRSVGENIAAGYRTVSDMFEGWKETDEPYSGQGHRRNMLNSSFTAIGIGHVYYQGYHYWVQEFKNPTGTMAETVAIDSSSKVKIKVDMDTATLDLAASVNNINLQSGQSADLPGVNAYLTTNDSWPTGRKPVSGDIAWSVSNTSVIKISSGKVVAVKAGSANLIATALGKTITIPVVVSDCTSHVWNSGSVTKQPTCIEPGVKTYTCTKCGALKTEAIATTEHVWNSGIVIEAATCEKTGERYHECTTNGCGAYKFTTIPKTAHTVVTDKAVAATCTAAGKTEGAHCSVCGTVTKAQTAVAALGHSWNSGVITNTATCTATGTKTFTCTRCSATNTETIPKTAHTIVTDKAVAATCTAAGKTEGAHCSVCGTVTKAQSTVAALGHSWNSGVVTNKATCKETGTKTYTCTKCSATNTETIPKTAHTIVTDKAVAATCTAAGKTEGAHCSVCGLVTKAQTTVGALGHKTAIKEFVPATVENDGYTEGSYCTVCKKELVKQILIPRIAVVSAVSTATYSGKQIKPTVTVKDANETALAKGTDYTISYGANTKIGPGTINVTFIGKYAGTHEISFDILPKTITGLTASSSAHNSVKLSWTKGLGGVGYKIYRATSKTGTYTLVKTVGTNATTSYTDSGLTCGKTYYYKIRAYRTVNGKKYYSKSYSAIVSGKPIPAKVTISSISNTSSKTAALKWAKISGASGYEIYRATSKSGTYSKVKTITSGSTVTYKNGSLTKGKTYYYKVRAYRTVSGKKVYGSYSAIKSLKIAK